MKRMDRDSRSRSRSPYARSKRGRATPPRRYSDSPPPSPPPDKYRKSPPSKYREDYHSKRDRDSSSRSDHADVDYKEKYYKHRRPTYKILCVSNLNSKISDGAIKEALNAEFKKFCCIGVKIVHEPTERLAYVYFKDYEDAREAKHAKSRLHLFDKQIVIEAVYLSPEPQAAESSSRAHSSSRRSYSPDPYYSHRSYRAPSPVHSPYTVPPPPEMGMPPHYIPGARRYPPVARRPPPHYYAEPIPPPYEHVAPYAPVSHSYHVAPHHMPQHHVPRHMAPQDGYYYYEKEKKFPNYLQHIPPEDDPMATRTLFVGNLEVGIPEPELRKMFEAFGNVEDIDIKRPLPGQGNAYAFVRFQNLDMAHRAKVELSGQYMGKFQCKIGYGKANPTTRIWVGGLGHWTSLTQLEREFDRFGAIKKIDYTKGETFAYISYDSIDAASAACSEMRGFPLGGPDKRLRIDFAIDPNAAPVVPPAPGQQNIISIPTVDGASKRAPPPGYYTPRSEPPERYWPGEEGAGPPGGYYDRGPRGPPSFHRKPDGFGHAAPPTVSKYRWTRADKGPDGQGGPNSESDSGRYQMGRSPEHGEIRDDSPRRRRKLSPMSPARSSQGMDRVSADGSEHRAIKQENGNGVHSSIFGAIKNLTEFSKAVPQNWHGSLVLKNSAFPTKMHSFSGDVALVESMMRDFSGGPPLLRITQRLRLDQPKLEDVAKRMTNSGPNGHCLLVGLPAPIQPQEAEPNNPNATQQRPLRNLVSYLKQKEAAGVISLPPTKGDGNAAEAGLVDAGGMVGGGKDSQGVLYAFPPGPFADDLLKQVVTNLSEDSLKEDHLVILVVKGPI